MHAPSFEAVKSDHHFDSSCQVRPLRPHLLLNASISRILFFVSLFVCFLIMPRDTQTLQGRLVQMWSSVRGMDTPPHKEAEGHTEERNDDCRLICKRCCFVESPSHLLSSPPALTTKRSPLVKRTLVRWAE